MAIETPRSDRPVDVASGLRLVDADIHPSLPQGLRSLASYMSDAWVKRLGVGPRPDWATGLPNTGDFGIPTNSIYTSLDGSLRLDAIPGDGAAPASSPAFVAEHLLDPTGIDRAVLLPSNIFGLGAVPNGDIASVISSATNDWLDDVWLQADPRYRAAIVISPQDPQAGAAEIRRMAAKRGVVQILIPANRRLLGDPHFYPIYDAANECGLPISVHPSAVESIYVNGPQIAGEPPWYYLQWHTTLTLPHQANAVSLVAHGVFERFPNLKIVFAEVGIAWLVEMMWRMDKNWKALRDETPWLTRLPSEYMLDHFRFTTQPFLEPRKRDHLLALIDMIDGERIMLFSTDFPHWDGDDPSWTLDSLPAEMRMNIGVRNAVELYGQRLLD
jgi:predicted TIM-barrel fold metal-dependent hydrolase